MTNIRHHPTRTRYGRLSKPTRQGNTPPPTNMPGDSNTASTSAANDENSNNVTISVEEYRALTSKITEKNRLQTTIPEDQAPKFKGRCRPNKDAYFKETQTWREYEERLISYLAEFNLQDDKEKKRWLILTADKNAGDYQKYAHNFNHHEEYKEWSFDQCIEHLRAIYQPQNDGNFRKAVEELREEVENQPWEKETLAQKYADTCHYATETATLYMHERRAKSYAKYIYQKGEGEETTEEENKTVQKYLTRCLTAYHMAITIYPHLRDGVSAELIGNNVASVTATTDNDLKWLNKQSREIMHIEKKEKRKTETAATMSQQRGRSTVNATTRGNTPRRQESPARYSHHQYTEHQQQPRGYHRGNNSRYQSMNSHYNRRNNATGPHNYRGYTSQNRGYPRQYGHNSHRGYNRGQNNNRRGYTRGRGYQNTGYHGQGYHHHHALESDGMKLPEHKHNTNTHNTNF